MKNLNRRTTVWILSSVIIAAIITYLGFHFYRAFQMGNVQYTKHLLSEYCIVISLSKDSKGVYPSGGSFAELMKELDPEFTRKYETNLEKEYSDKMPKFYRHFLTYPRIDKWGHALKYENWQEGSTEHFRIGSPGKDDVWEHQRLSEYKLNKTGLSEWDPNDDLIYSEDGAIQAPIQE